jgi:signal peptidase II
MPDSGRSKAMRSTAKWLLLALLLVLLDQFTKYLVVDRMTTDMTVPLLPFLSLVLTYNSGAAFSFLAGAAGWQRWFFVLIALGASILIVWMLYKHRANTFLCFGLALILGGAIGNLIDRLTVGAVVDFILVYWRQYHWPAFNVADSCISVGAAIVIWDGFMRTPPRSPAHGDGADGDL